MALVQRGNCRFFLRSVRRGGRVTSEYLGSGDVALALAGRKAEARRQATERFQERHREFALWSEFDAAYRDLSELNRAHARAAMYAAGFYLHRRQWRRKGNWPMSTPAAYQVPPIPDSVKERVAKFLEKRWDLEPKDCIEFFDSIRDELTPATYCWVIKRLTHRFNDLDSDVLKPIDPRARAQRTLLNWLNEAAAPSEKRDILSSGDRVLQRRYLDVLRMEIAGLETPLLEQMLADQIVLSTMEAHGLLRWIHASEKLWEFKEAAHYDMRRDRATRRMLDSIKLLHTLRTNAGPALQVNVHQNVRVETPAPDSNEASPASGLAEMISNGRTSCPN